MVKVHETIPIRTITLIMKRRESPYFHGLQSITKRNFCVHEEKWSSRLGFQHYFGSKLILIMTTDKSNVKPRCNESREEPIFLRYIVLRINDSLPKGRKKKSIYNRTRYIEVRCIEVLIYWGLNKTELVTEIYRATTKQVSDVLERGPERF